MAYAQGAAMRRRFSQSRTATTTTIDVAAPEGSFRPSARDLVVSVHGLTDARTVTSGSTAMTRYTPQELTTHASGWAVSDTGFVVVKQPDNFGALHIVVER